MLRHVVLNTIRMYNTKFREEYGQMILACDGGSWRKDVFPEYKANRKKARDKSDMDWGFFFDNPPRSRGYFPHESSRGPNLKLQTKQLLDVFRHQSLTAAAPSGAGLLGGAPH